MSKKKFALLIIFFCLASFPKAQELDRLKHLLVSASEDTAKVNLLYKLSNEYVWSFPDSGKMYAETGFQLARKLGYKYGEALCSGIISVGLSETGDFTNALDFGFRSLEIYQNLKDVPQTSLSHITLLICYRDQGDYMQALVQGYKAIDIQAQLPFNSWASQVIFANIASVYEKSNQLDSALYYAQKAYDLDKIGSSSLITLGNVYLKKNMVAKALGYFYEEVANDTIGANWSLMDTYYGMSAAFELANKNDSAIYFARLSFSKARNIDNPRGLMDASKQLAHLYEKQNLSDSTVRYLKLAVKINDSLFSRQKIREAQNFAFNKVLHDQEFESQRIQDRNRVKMYFLLGVVLTFLIIAFILWRTNRHKQKVNTLLQQQKQKVETTLTALKSTQAQLIQSEKMASLGELTAGIAHEIQNPLNFINNFSDVNSELIEELKSELTADNKDEAFAIANDIKENEQKINHHGKRADAIVKGMLQHSRASSGKKEPIDINALADEYLRLCYQAFRSKNKSFQANIVTHFDNSLNKINVVPQDIGRVLLNLFQNAFYAVNKKREQTNGTFEPLVSLSTKHALSPSDQVNRAGFREGRGEVIITVKDNGTGMPEHVADKVFQPFFTTKPTGEGTGLGLSLSYDIIKAHGGELKVETKEGEGSEFIIVLPVI